MLLRSEGPKRGHSQRADTSGVHDQYDDQFAGGLELRRNACGQAHRTESGCRFKYELQKCEVWLQKTQDERAAAYDERRQQRDDKSFLDDFSGHSAPERRGHPPGSRAARRLQKSEQRSGFYAASGGAGRRAYEHEKDQNKQAGVSERTDRIGGKTGRSSRNALKECAQPCDVFRRFQKQRAQKDQYRAHHDDDFGVQSQRAERTLF